MYQSLPDLPLSLPMMRDPDFHRLLADDPTFPRSPDNCPTCKGKGEFRWWNADRTEVVGYHCRCPDQWFLHATFRNAGIPDQYQRLTWADAKGVDTKSLTEVLAYLDKIDTYVQHGYGLVLVGNEGTGKSLLAALILKELIAKGHTGQFTTFVDMLNMYTGGWDDPDKAKEFHRRVRNSKVLVVDDVGKEWKGRSDLAGATFEEVLRHRVSSTKVTIITTNLDLENLDESYRVIRYLQERSTTVRFEGDNYRAGKAVERLREEMERGLTRPVVVY